jgi:hypothetical protein
MNLFQLNNYIIKCYLQNPYIKCIVNGIIQIKNTIAMLLCYPIEPPNHWYSISSLYYETEREPFNYLQYHETEREILYSLNEIFIFKNNNYYYLYNWVYNSIRFDFFLIPKYIEVDNQLIITKNKNNQHIVKILFKKVNDIEFIESTTSNMDIIYEKSKIYFLTVQYFQNNDDKSPITLEIPKSMFIVNNELLSPTFIYRCLKYQGYSFKFDMSYKIRIIDHDINMIELNYSNYIILKKDDYIIV